VIFILPIGSCKAFSNESKNLEALAGTSIIGKMICLI
jgi:hypothetical protein